MFDPDFDAAGPQKKADKKSGKVRSAWISFFGRIVAQVIGAAATVALGLMIANRVQRLDPNPSVAASAAVSQEAPRPRTEGVAIAVLPLDNFSRDPALQYVADGMTEALIADLSRIRALHVISRTSIRQYKDTKKPLPQIARELGVDVVIEGSVVLSGRRVRVTAQLVDAHHDRHLWAQTYDRDTQDVLGLQSDVARNVAREVNAILGAQGRTRLARSDAP